MQNEFGPPRPNAGNKETIESQRPSLVHLNCLSKDPVLFIMQIVRISLPYPQWAHAGFLDRQKLWIKNKQSIKSKHTHIHKVFLKTEGTDLTQWAARSNHRAWGPLRQQYDRKLRENIVSF